MLRIHLLLYLLACLIGLASNASFAQQSTRGDYFSFGFSDNSIERNVPNLWVVIAVPPKAGAAATDSVTCYLRYQLPEERSFDPPYTVNRPAVRLADTFRVARGRTYTIVFPTIDNASGSNHPLGLPIGFVGIDKLYPRSHGYRLMNANQFIDALGNWVPNPLTAISLHATDDIEVRILNQRPFTTDASVVYPVAALGSDYLISAYDETRTTQGGDPPDPTNIRADWISQFLIVAHEAVEVQLNSPSEAALAARQPSQSSLRLLDGRTLAPGQPLTVRLLPGQTHLVQSFQDLSGVRIQVEQGSCASFGVLSGNQCTTVGNCASCDHVVEMLLPVPELGTEHILRGVRHRREEMYRVVALEEDTRLVLHTSLPQEVELPAGGFHTFRLRNDIDDQAYWLTASAPVSVQQLGLGWSCDQTNTSLAWGDPYQLEVPSTVQMRVKEASIQLVHTPKARNNSRSMSLQFLNIYLPTELVPYLRIDGRADYVDYTRDLNPRRPLGSAFLPVDGQPAYSWASILFDFEYLPDFPEGKTLTVNVQLVDTTGQRRFTESEGFAAQVIALQNMESYGYTAAVGHTRPARFLAYYVRQVPIDSAAPAAGGEFWFRLRGGTAREVDLPTDPNNPSQTVREPSYTLRLERLNERGGSVVETIDNPTAFLVSSDQRRGEGLPPGLVLRLVGLGAGHYRLAATDFDASQPCGKVLEFTIEQPVGRQRTSNPNLGARLKPNPASDRLELTWTAAGEVRGTLTDALGRELGRYHWQGHSAVLDVEALPAGIYLLHVAGETGADCLRIVKQ